jgi:hypothetical protein
VVEFRSGLVDLVVGVGRHGGDGHRLTLAGERFVSLVAEDIAEVGDRGGDLGDRRCGQGIEAEAGDGGRRFIASEPVEDSGEDGQCGADRRGVARIVVVADCQSEVIGRGQGVAVFGLVGWLFGGVFGCPFPPGCAGDFCTVGLCCEGR